MANCNNNCNCKKDEKIPQKVQDDFAYVCMSRTLNKLITLVIVCICMLVATNGAWIWYESKFSDIVTTIEAEQDGSGVKIVSGGDLDYSAEGESNNP